MYPDHPITDQFAERYRDKTPPWGFEDMGYIVFKRTYARPILDDHDNIVGSEEWWQTIQRVINGAQKIGANYTQEEAERLYDYMFNLKGTVAGRMLWQLGTPNNKRLGGNSLNNCLGGETMVPTRDGAKRLDELAQVGFATVMTDYGKWVQAEIKNFGRQPLAKITFRRGMQKKTVRATSNHIWLRRAKNAKHGQRIKTTTSELMPGHRMVSIKGQGTLNADISQDGIRAGLVYGDGTVTPQGSRAFVSASDRPELEHLFLDYKYTETDKGIVFRNLPRSYKANPDLTESRSYLFGWLAGYFAADGYARNGVAAQIASTNRAKLQRAKDVAVLLGIPTGPIWKQDRTSNLTGHPSRLYGLHLHIEDPEFFLLSKHRGDFVGDRRELGDWIVESVDEYGEAEDVFCAVVPGTHTFALEDNLLTHNCWFVDIHSIDDFAWLFEQLMLGGGVGFSVDRPKRLGVVREGNVKLLDEADADFIVPDKREGWAELLTRVMKCYLGDKNDPSDMSYSTMLIRPAGTPIKTFGGTASGPGILIEGIDNITQVLDGAVNRELTSTEVLDVVNIIGQIVVSGNVRRSAQVSIGSPQDIDFLEAKRWDLGDIPSWRAMSNNSVYLEADQLPHLPDTFWEGYHGNGEPYGLFNLTASQQYGRTGEINPDYTISGGNPCMEVPLAHRESCNLSELFLPNIESLDELIDLSCLLYKTQKAVAAMPYLDRVTEEIVHRNMRLGLGVTGIAQALDKLDWLSPTYEALREFDTAWSAERSWPESVRLTTVKPSGSLSLLAGVTPGVHPGYARHHIRRVRMAYDDPLVNYCRSKGYHTEHVRNFDGTEDPRTIIVEFPCEFPEGTLLADDMTAVDLLDLQRRLQKEWADNAVSVSVYYQKEELPEIQDYLETHWSTMKSVSFLLHSDHGFDQAPLQEVSEKEYQEMVSQIKHDHHHEVKGMSTLMDGEECATGSCPIR